MSAKLRRGLPATLLIASIPLLVIYLLDEGVPAIGWPGVDIRTRIENAQYDLLFNNFRKTPPLDDRITYVEIDEGTLEEFGFPLPRERHDALLRQLAQSKSLGTTWDYFFTSARPGDAAFVEAMQMTSTVLAIGAEIGEDDGRTSFDGLEGEPWKRHTDPLRSAARSGNVTAVSAAAFADGATRVGHVADTADPDGVLRRVPLLIAAHGREIPSLGLASVLTILDVPLQDVHLEGRRLIIGGETLSDPIVVPVDEAGNMLVNFNPDPAFVGRTDGIVLDLRPYSVLLNSLELFEDEDLEELRQGLQGRMLIIGTASFRQPDFETLPHAASVPGVLITVDSVNTILTGSFIVPVSGRSIWLLALAFAVGAGLVAQFARPLFTAFFVGGCVVVLAILPPLLFWNGVFFPMILPTITTILAVVPLAVMGHVSEFGRATRTSQILSRFVSPALLQELQSRAGRDALPGAKRQEVTILFVDIAGFTPFTQAANPELLSRFLDRFYEMAMRVLFDNQGTLDAFQGDGVLAYFGAPESVENKEDKAVRTAQQIRTAFETLAAEHTLEGAEPLGIRCGIATGTVAVGYLGGSRYATYGIVGHHVNLAARIQGHAEVGDVLVDSDTAERLGKHIKRTPLTSVALKGIAEPVTMWRIE